MTAIGLRLDEGIELDCGNGVTVRVVFRHRRSAAIRVGVDMPKSVGLQRMSRGEVASRYPEKSRAAATDGPGEKKERQAC